MNEVDKYNVSVVFRFTNVQPRSDLLIKLQREGNLLINMGS